MLEALLAKLKSNDPLAVLAADLKSRLAAAEVEHVAARDAHVDALLHATDDTTDAKATSTRKAVAFVEQRIRDLESTLQGVRVRQQAVAAADAALAEAAREVERQSIADRVSELASQREQAANGIVVALNRFAGERKRFVEQSMEIRMLTRKLGVDIEPRGAGLDQNVFDGFVNHELGALGLPHGTGWNDPNIARPSLTKFVAASAAMIRAAVGRG